jgi:hypothetical protein
VRRVRNLIGIVAVLAVNAGIGYLFGGTRGGIAFPLATILLGLGRGTFMNTRSRQRERNEQRSHPADGTTVGRCARRVSVSLRQQD